MQQYLDDIEHGWGTPQSKTMAMRVPSITGDRNTVERIAAYYCAAARPGAAAALALCEGGEGEMPHN